MSVSFWAFFHFASASDQASWDGAKVGEENATFLERVHVLQKALESMLEDIGVTKKYCNEKGCWESVNDGQSLSFTASSGLASWSSRNFGQSIEWFDGEGTHWESLNEGQTLRYENLSKMEWVSANLGQTIEFHDGRGNTWESVNSGQRLRYEGANGKWESLNFGQRLEYDDESKQWENINDGQSSNYRDSGGNSWSTVNGDLKDSESDN